MLPIVLILLAGCADSGPPPGQSTAPTSSTTPTSPADVCAIDVVEPETISLVTLIANPAAYDGKAVRVMGYYHGSFEHSALYLSHGDFNHRLHKNGLWVSTQVPDEHNDTYILLEGIFSARSKGHMSLWSGSLCNVARVAPWSRVAPASARTR